MTDPTPRAARPRRQHAAIGGRVLAAGLSASGALALTAAMATAATADAPSPAVPAAPQTIVVRVVLADGRETLTPVAVTPVAVPAVPAAQAVTATKSS